MGTKPVEVIMIKGTAGYRTSWHIACMMVEMRTKGILANVSICIIVVASAMEN